MVLSASPEMAQNDGSDGKRGGRSSSEVGDGAMGHGGANGRVLRPPGDVLSTVMRSASSLCVCGHDGDMAGGAELSAVTANGVRGS